MNTAIVVLNWNGSKIIGDNIRNLISIQGPSTIIVVDNGSIDESINILEGFENKIILLKQSKNLGFAGGVNVGIRYAIKNNFDYVALFNNDAIADKYWLTALQNASHKKDVGIVTGLLLDADGHKIDSTGEQYSIWGMAFPRDRNEIRNRSTDSGYVFGATGGASLYSIKMLKEIGLFDEDFFAYYEDVDISFRAQLAGWKVYYTSRAIAYHMRGETSKKIPGFAIYQTFKNLPILFYKNVPFGLWFKILPRLKIAYILILGKAIMSGNSKYALKGVLVGLYLIFKKFPMRKKIQKNRKVSNRYINSILWHDLPPNQTSLRRLRNILTAKNSR